MLLAALRLRPRFTYYVDPVDGFDANNGLSPGAAWKTTTAADALTLVNQQSIGFKQAGVWTLYRKAGELVTNTVITGDVVTSRADEF